MPDGYSRLDIPILKMINIFNVDILMGNSDGFKGPLGDPHGTRPDNVTRSSRRLP